MKKMLALVMTLCMLLPACAMAEGYQYVSYTWDNATKALKKATGDVPGYVSVTANMDSNWGQPNESSWYVVDGNVTIESRIGVSGTVNLVLAPGSKLTAIKGITVEGSSRLNIYGTPGGAGMLLATGEGNDAGIGNFDVGGGEVWIHGGTVNTMGGADGGAGIGGNGSVVVISGGTVRAQGGAGSAGIGGGLSDQSCHVEILGGTVTARRGESDGFYDANDIGRGAKRGASSRNVITGGNVDAVYVDDPKNSEGAALQHRRVQLAGAGAGAAVSALCEIRWYEDKTIKYGFNDVVTVEDGMLHLWLPSSADVQDVTSGGYEYGLSTTSSEDVQVFKCYPAAAHFAVTPPQNAVYNGSAHEATVTPAAGVTGMGQITVHYRKAGETNWLSGAPVDAGTYEVGVSAEEGDNYLGSTEVITDEAWTFTIQPAELGVTIGLQNSSEVRKEYDGTTDVKADDLVTRASGIVTGDDVQVMSTYAYESANASVENLHIIAELSLHGADAGNYTCPATVVALIGRIEPINMQKITASVPNAAYTGAAIVPQVIADSVVGALREGVDYTVSMANEGETMDSLVEPGVYVLALHGKGNYTGVKQVTFEITAPTGGGESGGSEPGSGESSSGEPGGSTVQPDGYKLLYLLDGQKIPVGDSGCEDEDGRKMLSRLNWLTNVPEGLWYTEFNTIGKIADELFRQTKAAGFAADDDALFMAELGYQDEGVWTDASDEEHERAKRVRVRTELSGKVDLMNCDFLITHMFAHGERAGKVEIIRDYQIRRLDKPGAYELSFEMNGMSPVLISMKVKAPADAAANLPKTGDPSMLGAWAALLAVSAAGLKMRRKK